MVLNNKEEIITGSGKETTMPEQEIKNMHGLLIHMTQISFYKDFISIAVKIKVCFRGYYWVKVSRTFGKFEYVSLAHSIKQILTLANKSKMKQVLPNFVISLFVES